MESMMTGDVSPSRLRTASAATRSSSATLGAFEFFAFRVAAPSEAAAAAPARNVLRLTCIPDSLALCGSSRLAARSESRIPQELLRHLAHGFVLSVHRVV